MILLWGLRNDGPLGRVDAALLAAGAEVVMLDQRRALETSVSVGLEPLGAGGGVRVTGKISDGLRAVDLSQVSAAYLRPYDTRRIAGVRAAGPGSPAWDAAMVADDALLAWCEVTTSLVVNRPSAMASNNSKPYQGSLIERHGFAVPETLVTTEPELAEDFRRRHGEVVYKSVSGVRSIVARLSERHAERLPLVANCPTQFQQYVPGTDVRVHVVGTRVFASEITSRSDDYRYGARSGEEPRIVAAHLADDIAATAVSLTAALGLAVSGIDLRRTPEGDWYCFEVNPSPGFAYYEQATGQPIARAIAELLASA